MVKYIVKKILNDNISSKLDENEEEPNTGWVLTSVVDLEDERNCCQKKSCGKVIKYEYHIFHRKCGYKIVGSTCVEYLTDEERLLGKKIIGYFKKIYSLLQKLQQDFTKNGNSFLCVDYKKNSVRIYEDYNSFQTLKKNGHKLDFDKFFNYKDKTFDVVKKLAIVSLIGISTESNYDKNILRNIFKSFLN
jgi:hypothetical protein